MESIAVYLVYNNKFYKNSFHAEISNEASNVVPCNQPCGCIGTKCCS
ncbi:conserved hypothetical protein [Vibrio crassostreae]|nr:conserved hypothetical protein [Vibrio crassostreae]CAK2368768.1 conserved hypothetical protein [Vibrio crassostreae]CAK2378269.1 conserved hypothetical protein [Vibrio crassostreae]CAK2506526.1 conserved hypothetical protein [Vibrio crassostreae]CAK2539967.1 conserved hypothetical protein [Vibrio crassostreae]